MSHPARLASALAAVLGLLTLAGCGGSGTFVDSSNGQQPTPTVLGWSSVDPVAVELPTSDPITADATAPSDDVPVLVNIWASWCAPCKKELPLLQDIDAGGKLRVVGFSRDQSKDNAAEALREAGVTYPNWMDSDAELVNDLDGRVPYAAVPASLLIRDGQVIAVHLGEFKTADDVLRALELR